MRLAVAPRIVVDSSAVVELTLGLSQVDRVRAAIADSVLHAPVHMDAEVLSAVVRQVRRGEVKRERAEQALTFLARMKIRREPITRLLVPALALRPNVSAFDAIYVALARRLGASLLTADRKLAGAPNLGIAVTIVG